MTSIVLAADAMYLPHVTCNIAQLARFGRGAAGVTLAVPAGLCPDLVAHARAAADLHELKLDVVPIAALDPLRARRTIDNYRHTSYFTYSKLVLAETLQHLDEVLYLDVDTLVRAPLDDLLAWKLHHSVGGVVELEAGTHLFSTPRQPYFNAGVLRMSLERMRREQVWARSQMILEQHVVTLLDQDVFNLLFMDRFDSLPLTYNVFDTVARRHRLPALADPAIVHFAGPAKPWHPSNNSAFAREWRRHAAAVSAGLTQPRTRTRDIDVIDVEASRSPVERYNQWRQAGRSRLRSAAAVVLPEQVKMATKGFAMDVFDRTLCRVENMRAAVFQDQLSDHASSWITQPAYADDSGNKTAAIHHGDSSQGLDLLISVPHSGTNALGNAIENARPQVHWVRELYLGEPSGLQSGELAAKFPWFAKGRAEICNQLRPERRYAAQLEFTALMSRHAIEITKTVVESRSGRTLIKVFPCQLHPAAFAELLRAFRPRLLVLRRDLVFSYISQLRAASTGLRRESELTNEPFTANDQQARHHVLRSDSWFDGVARAANDLGLHSTWVTYDGLFATGTDKPLVEAFYPGPQMPVGPSGGLRSDLTVHDRRSDASVLAITKAVSGLSVATQSQLMRLPGSHP